MNDEALYQTIVQRYERVRLEKAEQATSSNGCKRIKEEMGSKYLGKKTTGQRNIATEERTELRVSMG